MALSEWGPPLQSAVQIIAEAHLDRRQELIQALTTPQGRGPTGTPLVVGSTEELLDRRSQDSSCALVVIGDLTRTAKSDSVKAAVRALDQSAVPVVMTYDPAHSYESQAPSELREINGFGWSGSDATDLATYLRRLLGIDELSRQVFLSYRRQTSEALAMQLRYSLIDAGWNVFLDQFNIPPSVNFQQELFRDMDGRSLLVVIEDTQTRLSQWVDDEIAFAYAHGVGICAITPRTSKDPRFADAQRIDVHRHLEIACEGRQENLRPSSLPWLLGHLQNAHTAAFRLRIEDLLCSIDGHLADAGHVVSRLSEKVVAGSAEGHRHVVLGTVSRPQLGDIHEVLRAQDLFSHPNSTCWLVYRLDDPDIEVTEILQHVGRRAGIRCATLGEFRREIQG